MRCSVSDNAAEHSFEVATIAYSLAVLAKKKFAVQVELLDVITHALFHDAVEVITGDMPTPIKYMNEEICSAMKNIETIAAKQLLNQLPDCLLEPFSLAMKPEGLFKEEVIAIVKAADKLSALIHCINERSAGNTQFLDAEESLRSAIEKMNRPETTLWMEMFLPAFTKTLDDFSSPSQEQRHSEKEATQVATPKSETSISVPDLKASKPNDALGIVEAYEEYVGEVSFLHDWKTFGFLKNENGLFHFDNGDLHSSIQFPSIAYGDKMVFTVAHHPGENEQENGKAAFVRRLEDVPYGPRGKITTLST